MAQPSEPLTSADLADINDALAKLADADELIEKSIRAGIPMEDQRKRSQETRSQLQKLKTQFFPGR